MTTSQSTSLAPQGGVERGNINTARQAPPYGDGKAPAARPERLSEAAVVARRLTRQVDDIGGPLTILDNVDFAVPAGQTVAITGSSGSGKSTLLGLLAGL